MISNWAYDCDNGPQVLPVCQMSMNTCHIQIGHLLVLQVVEFSCRVYVFNRVCKDNFEMLIRNNFERLSLTISVRSFGSLFISHEHFLDRWSPAFHIYAASRENNTETFRHRGRTLDFFSYQTSLLCLYALYIEQGSFRWYVRHVLFWYSMSHQNYFVRHPHQEHRTWKFFIIASFLIGQPIRSRVKLTSAVSIVSISSDSFPSSFSTNSLISSATSSEISIVIDSVSGTGCYTFFSRVQFQYN